MTVPRYISPLRYPGGKAKLAPFVEELLRANDLVGCDYVEPYAGGASVALRLLSGGLAERIHINDLDRSIYAFWHSVLFETESLCRLIRNKRVSVAEWRRQQEVQRSRSDVDLLRLGFSTFFLNRTNRSGIICSGGMIGGSSQGGHWRLDARYNKKELIERIERIAKMKERIALHHLDAIEFLTLFFRSPPNRSFLYLDPPYYVKGRRRLYANFYQHNDHEQVATFVARARCPWIVSYDDATEIRRLYSRFERSRYRLSYTARERYDGAEVMFFSKGLVLPSSKHIDASAVVKGRTK